MLHPHFRICTNFNSTRAFAWMSILLFIWAGALVSGAPCPAPSSSGVIPCDEVVVDVMVLYTPAAITAMNQGSAEQNLAMLHERIQSGLEIANQVHANSDTRLRMAIVHTTEIDITESTFNGYPDPTETREENILAALTAGTDGFAAAHALRDAHLADFVMLLVATTATAGVANRPVNFRSPDKAFSVLGAQMVDKDFTFAHEIAHNMGIGHSRTQPVDPYTSTEFFPYAAGWQWVDDSADALVGFCTVMTYEKWNTNPFGDRDYERIAHFSNPDVMFNGNPTGHPDDANAARVIRMGRFAFSGYRGEKARPSPLAHFPALIDFEDYLSFFSHASDNEIDWILQKGATFMPDTGPEAAHSGDYYLHVASSNQPEKSGAIEIRLNFTGWSNPAIDFHYHMRETGTTGQMGTLFLEARLSEATEWTPLWSRTGHQGDNWLNATVSLADFANQVVEVRFRALTAIGSNGDIALDTVTFTAEAIVLNPYEQFVATFYPHLSNPAPDADPDQDGVSNFVEYAFGMQLDVPGRDLYPVLRQDEFGRPTAMEFMRARAEVRYRVLMNHQLSQWEHASVIWDSLTSPDDLVPVGEMQSVALPVPTPGQPVFFRMEVSLIPIP